MALNPCPECARQISDRAPACPHCGAHNPDAPPAQQPFLQSQTAHTAVKGLAAWLLASWVAKLIFALAGLAFLAYILTQ